MNNYRSYDVSVIVPVYKVENFLNRCVDSIINQTYKRIEIILVNDGSPDNSGNICDMYAEIDSRVRVIHKNNGGLSDARNSGFSMANGEYTIFIDSDDYIELDAIEKMISFARLNQLDIVCCNAYKIINDEYETRNSIIVGGTTDQIMSGQEYLIDSIIKKKYTAAVWTRMYKTSLLKNKSIFFKKGILHEDEDWTPRVLLAANRVGYYNFTFYNYIVREGSITQVQNREKHIRDVIATCNELVKTINHLKIDCLSKKILNDYYARLYMNTVTYGVYNKKTYKDIIDKKFVIRNAYFIKSKAEAFVYFFNEQLYRYIKLKRINAISK